MIRRGLWAFLGCSYNNSQYSSATLPNECLLVCKGVKPLNEQMNVFN